MLLSADFAGDGGPGRPAAGEDCAGDLGEVAVAVAVAEAATAGGDFSLAAGDNFWVGTGDNGLGLGMGLRGLLALAWEDAVDLAGEAFGEEVWDALLCPREV